VSEHEDPVFPCVIVLQGHQFQRARDLQVRCNSEWRRTIRDGQASTAARAHRSRRKGNSGQSLLVAEYRQTVDFCSKQGWFRFRIRVHFTFQPLLYAHWCRKSKRVDIFLLRDLAMAHYQNGNCRRKAVLLAEGTVQIAVQCVAVRQHVQLLCSV
jgi:hypothetical protein